MKTIDNFDITTNPNDAWQRAHHLRHKRHDGRPGGGQFNNAGWFLSRKIALYPRKQALTSSYVKLPGGPTFVVVCNHPLHLHGSRAAPRSMEQHLQC
ncbi:hypothetical protein IVA87_06080 [Bradyrhizobium sp. 147]|uniref:hypothetical protein n=1 Tax=unclassified Bradyrhizobium TaxID=2631580 RepID=UPI001FFA15EC|nr:MULTISPECIES: hypothetical protein [unclassified Bradyrhizobium]MCK1545260.1 hypothetical protein [Bradyrhizobium sp. 179]MCK1625660.1 hypothetical protein [Bradyrhizobium sp. 160]MCK1679050.1 hypothetical protein [Bradyrhizobium sp. 147]